MAKIITLTITQPKTVVEIDPTLEGARKIQVISSHYEHRTFIKLEKKNKFFRVSSEPPTDENTPFLPKGYHSILDLKKTFNILDIDGEWFIKYNFDIQLAKELHTQLGVPEILKAGVIYPLIYKKPPVFSLYCDIVDSSYSYDLFPTKKFVPSHLLSVVPSPIAGAALPVKQIYSSYLNRLELMVTNLDGSNPTFGMGRLTITLKVSQ